jgi:WD40 repeat protein
MNTARTTHPQVQAQGSGIAVGGSVASLEKPANPYVGPRTFKTDEREFFFGRDREAQDLLSVVITERLVLFYAQSGAGKSSLINTSLIPGLIAEEEYRILPVGRLLGESEIREDVDNIFIHHLISSLVKRRIDESVLSKLTLSQFLARLDYDEEQKYFYNENITPGPADEEFEPGWKFVLIIDQFEELFTTHQAAWQKREGFFRQLAQALEDFPNLSIVLVMRDDYVAVLEPYAYLLPGKLRGRYYMERLGHQAARKAVEGPAARQNRPFVPEVAEKLVNDLSSVKVRTPDGQVVTQAGQYVEPVQLQVICSSLWDKLEADAAQITWDLVEEYVGDVNTALGTYFARRVGEVVGDLTAQGKFVSEYEIRQWFENRLITLDGFRNMVAQVPGGTSGGLEDFIVQAFVQRGDLVRAEKRGGGTFYELTHDRLIEPIRQNNRAWFETNADLIQKRVPLWLEQGRNNNLLLRGRELRAARKLARQRPLNPDEQSFLDASGRAERTRYVTVTGVVLFLLSLTGLTLLAVNQTKIAQAQRAMAVIAVTRASENQILAEGNAMTAQASVSVAGTLRAMASNNEKMAQVSQIHAEAQSSVAKAQIFQNTPGGLFKSTLLAMDSMMRQPSSDAEEILRENLTFLPRRVDSDEIHQDGAIDHMVFSSGGTMLFTTSWDERTKKGQICGWVLQDRTNKFCEPVSSRVHDLVFTNDQLLASDEQGQVKVLTLTVSNNVLTKTVDFTANGKTPIRSINIGPDGRKILVTREDGSITVKEIRKPDRENYYLDTSLRPTAIDFSPKGNYLAAGAEFGTVAFWGLSDGSYDSRGDHRGEVNVIRFTPDERYIISGGKDHYAMVIDRMSAELRYRLPHSGSVNFIAVSPDGTWVATASEDRQIRVWDLRTGKEKVRMLQDSPVTGLAISPGGQMIVTAGEDKYVHAWNAETGQEVLQIPTDTGNPVLAFNTQDDYLYIGDPQGKVSAWDISTLATPARSLELNGMAENLEYLQDQVAFTDGSKVWILPTEEFKNLSALPKDKPDYTAMSTLSTITRMALSPDLTFMAVTTEDNTLEIEDRAQRKILSTEKLLFPLKDMAFAPHGRRLITLDTEGFVSPRITIGARDLSSITGPVSAISVGPQFLAMGTPGKIWLLDLTNEGGLTNFDSDGDPALLAFSKDGSLLAEANTDGQISLWQQKKGQLTSIKSITLGNTATPPQPLTLAFSPDGKQLAVGTARNVFLVDTEKGREIARIPVTDIVNHVSFSGDGHLLSVASSNLIQTWELESMQPIDNLLQAACARVGKNLDEAQWKDVLSQEIYDSIMQVCGS